MRNIMSLALTRLPIWIAVVILIVLTQSCRTPVVGSLEVQADMDSTIATTRFDGDTLLVVAHAQMTVEVFQKDGAQLFGPYTVPAGKIFLWSRSMEVKATYAEGDVLPAWVLTSGILRPGDEAKLGLVFAAPDAIVPPAQ